MSRSENIVRQEEGEFRRRRKAEEHARFLVNVLKLHAQGDTVPEMALRLARSRRLIHEALRELALAPNAYVPLTDKRPR